MAEQRIQKVLADQGICSRREAERLIAAGKVKVNGHPVTLGDKMDPDYDKVMIDGQTQRIVRKRQYTYIMLHKPRGYLTTRSDDRGRKTVMDLVSDVPAMLRPVGRLDKDSEGLLLMTNDGDFANYMMHPSHNVDKTYLTRVEGEDIGLAMEYLREPMELDGYVVDGAEVGLRSLFPGGAELEITIHEGRNRQVRKMCEAVGLKVLRLKRISEDALELGELKPGAWRYLTPEELERVRPKGER